MRVVDDSTTAPMRARATPSSFSHQSVVAADDDSTRSDDSSGAVLVDPATVDLVLEMTATFDADGFQTPSLVSRSDVVAALLRAHNDVAAAVDEVMSMIAIKQLRADEAHARAVSQASQDAQLQWHELCAGLGVSECDAFMQALDSLPDDEKNALLSTNGGFLQQLLLELDDESHGNDDDDDDAHPLAKLQSLYPDYRMEVIENVFEQHGFDVNATADALHNLRGINSVQSFAAVVSAQSRAVAAQEELQRYGPKVASLGHFPDLPTASKTKPTATRRSQRQQRELLALQRKPSRLNRLNGTRMNAWERQDIPVSSGSGVLESTLSSELKIDRLKAILPGIDRGVIQTTFFLHGCNSDVTEASLREIFNLPVVVPETHDVGDDADAPMDEVPTDYHYTESPSYASSRARVDAARDVLSDRYCAVLESFRRNHNVIATDRVRELSRARRDVRESQREAAHQYFLSHVPVLRQGRPIDLHGLIVMEALQVANEAIEYCREQRIRRCLFICGVGHHSIGGKARILTAMQLSLSRRQIAFRTNGGVLMVFPLRSSSSQ